jgi:hypothetical protein
MTRDKFPRPRELRRWALSGFLSRFLRSINPFSPELGGQSQLSVESLKVQHALFKPFDSWSYRSSELLPVVTQKPKV